ncbi:hypothetical protein D6745_01655 [Candidatus Woesearchaeota archaeon]|nr:MAG: hypothetical protein D6745_01655 [Candidatus Woesearchaeota archaeon]
MKQKIDLIWNITRLCAWDCGFCCTDSYHVSSVDRATRIRLGGLEKTIETTNNGNVFESALRKLQELGLELTLKDKLTILENLLPFNCEIDFSGGDPLLNHENLEVIRRASQYFGRGNISITPTGAGLSRVDPSKLCDIIGKLDFTYDNTNGKNQNNRPAGYNTSNLRKAKLFTQLGVKTKAQTPLYRENMNPDIIRSIYLDLHEARIPELLLLRTFPVGRGIKNNITLPTLEEYVSAIHEYKQLEKKYGIPKVRLQCALKHLFPNKNKGNPCDSVRSSLGITSLGIVLASPWAYNHIGQPLDEQFVLGDLKKEDIKTIYFGEKAQRIMARADENFGHCKVFAFLNANPGSPDALFQKKDYLYNKDGIRG